MGRLPCLLLLALTSATLAPAAPRLRIGVENNAPPLSYIDAAGQPMGFSSELLREMARVSGLDIEIVTNSWKASFDSFRDGRLDALANMTITEERRELMDFSIGHAKMHGVVFYRPDRPALHRTADFKGKTIATLRGSIGSTNALRHPAWGATIRAFTTWQAALDATDRGECDAALFISRPSAPGTDEHGLRRAFVDDIVHQYRFAVHKGDMATLLALNDALATVLHNGSYDSIYRKWIGPIEPHPIRFEDLRPYYWPFILTSLVLASLFIWQRHMMKKFARQAEALRVSEERWKFALEASGGAMWDWDIPANHIVYSQWWKELLGFPDADANHTREEWQKRLHPDDETRLTEAWEAHSGGSTDHLAVEHRVRTKDGTWIWILNRGRIVQRDASGKPLRMIGSYTDLTASKQAEKDRLILGKLESTGILAGGIAHDFNNLLTTIILNLDLAQLDGRPREETAQRLQDIRKAAFAARDLTQRLIAFAKGGTSERRRADLEEILRESARLALSGSAVRSEITIADDLWPVHVDAGQIAQAFHNLLLNAREAMTEGGVISLRTENTTVAEGQINHLPPGCYVQISVADHGPGIPPDVLPSVFDPYFSTKERGAQKGMGLGLTICHSIVKNHGGAIMVDSALMRGTTFRVYLPASLNPTHTKATESPQTAPAFAGRILVMDDEEMMRATIERALQQLGYEAEIAPNGAAAIALYKNAKAAGRPFSAVILDLTVRGAMGGLEALRELLALDPAVHAIVMSGYSGDKALHDYARHGFKSALRKPFSLEMLRTALTGVANRA